MTDNRSGSPRRYEFIADRLGEMISSGVLPAGARFTESRLLAAANTGRTPVRAALQLLQQRGQIDALGRNGFVVLGEVGTRDSDPDAIDWLDIEANLGGADATDAVADVIESQILLLAVKGCWRLNVSAMGIAFNLKRSFVETLLRHHEASGLLAAQDRIGWTVLELDEKRLDEIFFVRRCLEPNLLAEAVIHIPLELLQQTIADHETALKRYPDVTASELDQLETALHETLLAYAGNSVGCAALKRARGSLLFSKHILASQYVPLGIEEPFIVEHISILEAIRRRNSEECRLRLQAHLIKSKSKVAARLAVCREAMNWSPPEYARKLSDDR